MKYLLLIYHNEQQWNGVTESDKQEIYSEYRKLREQLLSSGKFIDGSQLQPTSTACAVRIRDGKDFVTDGPFAETHEQLGGYFLIDVKSADEALAIAKKIPSASSGTIEVRALVPAVSEAKV